MAEKETPGTEESKAPDAQLELFAKHTENLDKRMTQLVEELKESRQRPAPAEPARPAAPERIYTAAELQRLVDNGDIKPAEMTEYLATVKAQQLLAESEKRQKEERERERTTGAATALIGEYRAAIPELADRTSDTFKRVAKAFERLRKAGAPDSAATELAALQIVCGEEPGKAAERQPRETTADRQRSVEESGTGGGRRSSGRQQSADSSGLPSWLEPHRATFYKNAIERGVYKGPKDPTLVKELEILKGKQDRKKERAA